MAVKTKGGRKRDLYLELILKLPLRPIRSDEELDAAIAMIDSLIDRAQLQLEEKDYLDVLSDLVEAYETKEHPIEPVSDAAMLRHLIEAKEVSQTDVANATGIAGSTLSEVLLGKRRLTRRHIGKLSHYFHVSPAVFQFGE